MTKQQAEFTQPEEFVPVLRVRSDEVDGDEFGNEWRVEYVLFRTSDFYSGLQCFDLYTDDGQGNGVKVCSGDNHATMRSLALKLGDFVNWGDGR